MGQMLRLWGEFQYRANTLEGFAWIALNQSLTVVSILEQEGSRALLLSHLVWRLYKTIKCKILSSRLEMLPESLVRKPLMSYWLFQFFARNSISNGSSSLLIAIGPAGGHYLRKKIRAPLEHLAHVNILQRESAIIHRLRRWEAITVPICPVILFTPPGWASIVPTTTPLLSTTPVIWTFADFYCSALAWPLTVGSQADCTSASSPPAFSSFLIHCTSCPDTLAYPLT